MERYSRNISTLTLEENENLKNFQACVVGCGGIGGYIIEMLGRLGIGCIKAIDGDCFEESNLNRQLLSDVDSLGESKALKAKARMEKVNPLIKVIPVAERMNKDNAAELLAGSDIVLDALDSISSRLMLQAACKEAGIPMIHGAIAGWYAQITTILPGDDTLSLLYPENSEKGIETILGNPSFTPALAASLQVCEALKVFLNRGELLRNKLLMLNLLDNQFDVIDL